MESLGQTFRYQPSTNQNHQTYRVYQDFIEHIREDGSFGTTSLKNITQVRFLDVPAKRGRSLILELTHSKSEMQTIEINTHNYGQKSDVDLNEYYGLVIAIMNALKLINPDMNIELGRTPMTRWPIAFIGLIVIISGIGIGSLSLNTIESGREGIWIIIPAILLTSLGLWFMWMGSPWRAIPTLSWAYFIKLIGHRIED